MFNFDDITIYNTLIAIVLRGYNALSNAIVDFYLFHGGPVDIKYEPF